MELKRRDLEEILRRLGISDDAIDDAYVMPGVQETCVAVWLGNTKQEKDFWIEGTRYFYEQEGDVGPMFELSLGHCIDGDGMGLFLHWPGIKALKE